MRLYEVIHGYICKEKGEVSLEGAITPVTTRGIGLTFQTGCELSLEVPALNPFSVYYYYKFQLVRIFLLSWKA